MRLIPNFFFLFLLIGLFAPYVQAASIAIEQGTTLGPTNITNASINATANFSADIIIVDNYFIQIENFTSYNSIGYFIVHLINITQTNTTISSGDFPIFSDANENSITTINNYNVTFNASFNHTTSTIPSSPRQLYPNGTHQTLTYTYAGGVFSAQGVEIPPGVSTIELDTAGPSIVIAGPGNTSSDLDGTLNFTFTPTDDNLLSCSLYIENQLWTTANSTNGTLSNITVTMVDNSPGGAPLSWFISCVDTAGNTANSSTYLLTTIQTGITAPAAGPVGGGGGGATTTPAAVPIDTTPLAVEPEQATTLNSFFKSDMAKFVLLALFIVGMIWVFGGFKR